MLNQKRQLLPSTVSTRAGSSSSLLLSSLELSDTQVYEPYIRARFGTAAHFCEVGACDGGDSREDADEAVRAKFWP